MDFRFHRFVTKIFIIPVLFGCFYQPNSGELSPEVPLQFFEQESIVKLKAENTLKTLHRNGMIINDGWSEVLFATILDRLHLPQEQRPNIVLLSDPVPNAFSLYNGTICIQSGLLSVLTNTEQLAFVIAHEIAHWLRRHALYQYVGTTNTILTAHVVDSVAVPVIRFPLLSDYAIEQLSSVSATGYGRDLEREADQYAVKILEGSSFDLKRSSEIFLVLEALSSKYGKDAQFSFLMSHPSNQERLTTLSESLMQNRISLPDKITFDAQFMKLTAPLRFQNAQWNQRAGRYFAALDDLASLDDSFTDKTERKFETAETYRMMTQNVSFTLSKIERSFFEATYPGLSIDQVVQKWRASAKSLYDELLRQYPPQARFYRGIGLLEIASDAALGKKYLTEYLRLHSHPSDEKFIQELIHE